MCVDSNQTLCLDFGWIFPRKYVCHNPTPDDLNRRFLFCNGILYYKRLFYILEGLNQLLVFKSWHDFPLVRHFGFNKTMKLIFWDFWWLQMWKTIEEFVIICDIYLRSKNPRHRPCGLLQLLPTLKNHELPYPWTSWLTFYRSTTSTSYL